MAGAAAIASRVASMMPGLLRSSGIQAPGALRAAEPVSALRAGHWATGFRDPMVIACRTSYTSAKALLTSCQDAGRVGKTLINVLVRPYASCAKQTCVQPGKAEVLAWATALPGMG